MKAIILLLPLLIVLACVFLAGYALRSRQSKHETWLLAEYARELKEWQALGYTLTRQASEHVVLGETFPTIVLDEINKTRTQIQAPPKRNEIK